MTEASEVQRRLALYALPAGWALSLHDATGARIAHHGWVAGPGDGTAPEGGLVHSQSSALTGHRVTVSVSPQVVRAPVLAAALALAAALCLWPALAAADASLDVVLGTRGTLKPSVAADAQTVHFRDALGAPIVTYAGLKVWDADGQVLCATRGGAAFGLGGAADGAQ